MKYIDFETMITDEQISDVSKMYYHKEELDSLDKFIKILESIEFQKSGMTIEDYLQTLYVEHTNNYLIYLNKDYASNNQID